MNMVPENFIRSYNALDKDFCNFAIDYFEQKDKQGETLNRDYEPNVSYLDKSDTHLYLETQNDEIAPKIINSVNEAFWNIVYPQYSKQFPMLEMITKHSLEGYKLQRSFPGQGYHMWHCEQDSSINATRIYVYTLYLNDIHHGGETEFLYQNYRESPRQGVLSVFPAGYTHTHRGNPPLKETKYIITGWGRFLN